ncbi:MAG: ArnT family glycosyltransferase [Burkholderiaceae bacterium]
MKPVRLPASATDALPRWGVFALGLLYILPGLIGRDPWKNVDATAFGIMWTMAHGGLADWLWPHVVGLPIAAEGPLAFWIGAACIRLFGWLVGDPMAARLANILFFMIGGLSVWRATFVLGRRGEAQPLKLAFGGQPEARDFGRTLADGAFLIYVGCLGLLTHSHESGAEALAVSLVACALYAAIAFFDGRSLRSAVGLGLTLGLLALTRGYVVPLGLWLGILCLAAYRDRSAVLRLAGITMPMMMLVAASWMLASRLVHPFDSSPFDAWMAWNSLQVGLPSLGSIGYFLRYQIWFAWPAWPFAGWAVYAWRRDYKGLHISLPLAFVIVLTLLAFLNPHPQEAVLLPLLPPLAILAAFGLPTMKRGAINAVDWFSVMTLSTCAGFIWLGWIAKETGWPAQLAKNASRLVPGFKPEFEPIAMTVAALATIGWILLVHWRISRRPAVLWRAVVLSSGGIILCWLLLTTLWLPWIDYSKSYAGVSRQIAEKLPPPDADYCVETNVGSAQRASFAYFGNVHFAGFDDSRCDYLLLQDRGYGRNDPALFHQFGGRWHFLWEGRRPSDRDERFRLYRRASSVQP